MTASVEAGPEPVEAKATPIEAEALPVGTKATPVGVEAVPEAPVRKKRNLVDARSEVVPPFNTPPSTLDSG